MQRMLPTVGAEFVELQPNRVVLAAIHCVVAAEALRANQKYFFSCHIVKFQRRNLPPLGRVCQEWSLGGLALSKTRQNLRNSERIYGFCRVFE